jgi:CRISPR-associated protein (TIGR02584 family)
MNPLSHPPLPDSEPGPLSPGQYRRRVLFAVSGLSPQIITETVYALAVAAGPDTRFIPTEVQVLTTTEGALRIRLALLSAQPGGFARLCRDYGLPPIAFDEGSIHLIVNDSGSPLPDIRTESDNQLVADAITERIREVTSDPACALHVSMAGGRKTMGYYAGYALSLFGREQDRLSHVLVSAPFESSYEFFYPTPYPHVISLQGGKELADASSARVSLAEIPFVRLRQGLPQALLEGRSSFAGTVRAASASTAPPQLVLNIGAGTCTADGRTMKLSPMQFLLLAAMAQRASAGRPALRAPHKEAHDEAWAAEVLADARAAVGMMHLPSQAEDSLRRDCSGTKISPHLSRLRRLLRDNLSPGRDVLYFSDGGTARHKRYSVPLTPAAIRIVGRDLPGQDVPGAASLQSGAVN